MNLVSIDTLGGKRWEQKTVTPKVPHRDPVIHLLLYTKKKKRRTRLNPVEDTDNSHTLACDIHLKICLEITERDSISSAFFSLSPCDQQLESSSSTARAQLISWTTGKPLDVKKGHMWVYKPTEDDRHKLHGWLLNSTTFLQAWTKTVFPRGDALL